MSRDQNAERSHSVKTANSFFENVEEFKYLGITVTNQYYIQEEIKSKQKSGNACYHFLSKNRKIKIYRNINFASCFVQV